ncbi:MAG: hypothetical protein AUJ07_03610 [Crenarchaeota archaeon 13_1_40CM_3_53_5]|nr:MAG: hypothetical protein AUJ07_03610 [Crenarchaeota archaeon 13_1_40CM_3_53_5]
MYAVLGVVIIIIVVVAGLYAGGYFPGTGMTATASAKAYDTGSCTSASNCDFTPATLSVSTNTKVTWTSNSTTVHTVTACSTTNSPTSAECPTMNASGLSSFDSGASGFGSGQSFSYTFTTAGTYYYYCRFHNWMHAQVNVS